MGLFNKKKETKQVIPEPVPDVFEEDDGLEVVQEERQVPTYMNRGRPPVRPQVQEQRPQPQRPVPKPISVVEEEEEEPIQQLQEPAKEEPKYVAVPRVVPIETMVNELYDGQQELKQLVNENNQLLQKLIGLLEK